MVEPRVLTTCLLWPAHAPNTCTQVTKQELLNGYLSDARLRELVSKML